MLKRPAFLPVPSFGPKLLLGGELAEPAVHRPAGAADVLHGVGLHVPRIPSSSRRCERICRMTRSANGPSTRRRLVVGAGLAGLTAASDLQRRGPIGDRARGVRRRRRPRPHRRGRRFPARPWVPGAADRRTPRPQRQLDLARTRLQAFDREPWCGAAGEGHVVGDPLRSRDGRLSTACAPIGTIADKLRSPLLRTAAGPHRSRRAAPGTETSTATACGSAGFSPAIVERFFRPLFGGIQLDPVARARRAGCSR